MGAWCSTASAAAPDAHHAALKHHPSLQRDCFPSSQGQTLQLQSSQLGYCVYGDASAPRDRTILFFHGTPGTRFFFSAAHHEYSKQHNVRVLLPERVGYGLSTMRHATTLLECVQDFVPLLDALEIEKVHLVAYSAGGPFALAFASSFPHRCLSLSLVCSLSPNAPNVTRGMSFVSKLGYFLATYFPMLLRMLLYIMVFDAKREVFLHKRSEFTAEENELFSRDFDLRYLFARSTLELYSKPHGYVAEANEYCLMAQDWHLQLQTIDPNLKIFLFGGQQDFKCTADMFHVLNKRLPQRNLYSALLPDTNHLLFYHLFQTQLFQHLGLV